MAIVAGVAIQNSSATVLRRFLGNNNEPVSIASISALSFRVQNVSVPATPVETIPETALTVADVIFDTPVVDERWTLDAIGYNLALVLPANSFPLAENHSIAIKVSFVSGEPDIILGNDVVVSPTYF